MKARKLLLPSVLEKLAQLTKLGVPVAKAMRDCGIDGLITRPTVVALLKAYAEDPRCKRTKYSLFPLWLDRVGTAVQEQPENWDYIGFFPQGYWECKV